MFGDTEGYYTFSADEWARWARGEMLVNKSFPSVAKSAIDANGVWLDTTVRSAKEYDELFAPAKKF